MIKKKYVVYLSYNLILSSLTPAIASKCVISFFSTQSIDSLNADSFLTDMVITKKISNDSIKDLSVNSVAGPDVIPASLLKQCSSEHAPVLHILFTDSLLSGYIYPSLKYATIVPVFKARDKTKPPSKHGTSDLDADFRLFQKVQTNSELRQNI